MYVSLDDTRRLGSGWKSQTINNWTRTDITYIKQKHGKQRRRITYQIWCLWNEPVSFKQTSRFTYRIWRRISPALARTFCEREEERNLPDSNRIPQGHLAGSSNGQQPPKTQTRKPPPAPTFHTPARNQGWHIEDGFFYSNRLTNRHTIECGQLGGQLSGNEGEEIQSSDELPNIPTCECLHNAMSEYTHNYFIGNAPLPYLKSTILSW